MRPEHWLYTIPLRLRSLFRREQADQELDEELRDHLEQKTAEHVAKGMMAQEAHRAALLEMGGVEKRKEECRDTRRVTWIQDLVQDLRYGLRMLRKSPGFTAVAVLTLAFGIGANTAIFSVTDAILLRPLPYKDPSQVVFLMETNPRSAFGEAEPSLPDINDWRSSSKTIQQFATFTWQNYFLTGGREPELVWGLRVSPEFLSTLGVDPSQGRAFSAAEAQAGSHVIVISNALWHDRFAGNRNVLGQTIALNDNLYTVAGILPPSFRFPPRDIIPGMDPQIFAPLAANAKQATDRNDREFDVVARLKPGVSVQRCQIELSAIANSLARRYPTTNKGWGVELTPVNEEAVGSMRVPLLILVGAVGLVLLLACANVANLLLARNASRRKEISLRSTLGASRFRIMRQLLTESLLLALLASVLGVIAAAWSVRLIVSAFPANIIPRISDIRIDGSVLWFSLLLAFATTVMFGLFPAFHASRPDVQRELRSLRTRFPWRSHFRTSSALVTLQVSVSLILLIGAGLLIHSMARLLAGDTGFRADGVLTARLELPPNRYGSSTSVESFHQRVVQNVGALPGVESAAIVMTLPLSGRSTVMYVEREGASPNPSAAQGTAVEYNAVTAGYFHTMRVPLLSGRDFSDADERGTGDVAIVNEAMAREFWPKENPIGGHFRFGESPWLRVIGLVKNEKYWSLTNRGKPEFYLPYGEASRFGATYLMRILTFLVVRSALRPQVLGAEIRGAVWKVDPSEPVADIETMDRLVSDSIAPRRFATFLLSVLGGLAAWLALTGLFAVMAYSVSQRTHEIGVRMALGAQRGDVLRMVIREGMLLAASGIAVGIMAALGVTRFLRSLLFEIKPTDPTTFVGVSVALALVALAACYIPARHATRVDPMVALRYE